MKLSGEHIQHAVDTGAWIARRNGKRVLSNELTINPNSVDVSLSGVALYPRINSRHGYVDLHDPNSLRWDRVEANEFFLRPGDFILMSVRERFDCINPIAIDGQPRYFEPAKFTPMIDGRSTSGRCGLSIHCTAGFGDYGFGGNFTLEVTAQLPIILRCGDDVGQVYFDEVSGGQRKYVGAYTDQGDEPRAPVLGRDRFRRF